MTADMTLSSRLRVRGELPDEAVSHYIRRLHVERFEAAAVIDGHEAAVKAAVAAEREACAIIGRAAVNECRELEEIDLRSVREHVAAAIRARANGGE